MRTYKETLDIINENKLRVLDVNIVISVDELFEFDLTDEEFEMVCNKVKDVYLELDEGETDDIVYCFNDKIKNGTLFKDLLNENIYTLVEEVSYYI